MTTTIRKDSTRNNNAKQNSHTEKPTSPLTAALYYFDHGCFVIPCCTMSPAGQCTWPYHKHEDPKSIGKQPIVGHDWQNFRLTREGIERLWTENPDANVGVQLEPSHLLLIDPDSPAAIEEVSRKGLPPGPQVRTGNGEHHYFRNRKGIIGATTRQGESGRIDVLSQGIAVGFGSTHRNGKRYELLVSWEDWDLEDPPLWAEELLLAALKKRSEAAEIPTDLPPVDLDSLEVSALIKHVILTGKAPPHTESYPSRSEALWAVLMALVEADHSNITMASILLDPRYTISDKPRKQGRKWTAKEIARARAKAATNGAREFMEDEQSHAKASTEKHTKSEEEPQTEGGTVHNNPDEDEENTRQKVPPRDSLLTDIGNGERLKVSYGEKILYNNLAKKFLVWDGQRWTVDQTQQVRRWARDTIRSLYDEAKKLIDDTKQEAAKSQKKDRAKRAKDLLFHAVKSEADPRINAMIHNVQMDCPVEPKELDTDLWLLNVANGTLDLRTGQLNPHRREDRITKLMQIAYDSEATCPLWEAFLKAVMDGEQDVIDFLKKAIGYSLTGDVREDCLFLLHGSGANGKSTFLKTLRALFADYGKQAPFSTFLVKDKEAIPNDLAALQGARLVVASETEDGKRMAMSVVKALTGREPVPARFLFQEYFEYPPQMKIWLGANHKPVITGTDHASWRRIRLIPFTQKFEGKTDDKDLGAKLLAELPGILAWAVRGCLAWQAEGLPLPEIVREATEGYRAESNVIDSFLEECCRVEDGQQTSAGNLLEAFKSYSGDKKFTHQKMKKALEEKGFIRQRSSLTGHMMWQRIGILLTGENKES